MSSQPGSSKQKQSKIYYGDHKASLLSSLNNDRDDDDSYCDVTLEVEGRKFPAHRCVLGKLSPFFNRMFKSEMREKYDTSPTINGVSSEMFQIIMDFFYTATVSITEDNVMELLMASDYLQVDAIKRFCVEFLSENMNKSNCLDIKATGDIFNCSSLSDTADTVAAQNFEEVIQQSQFKELPKKEALEFLKTRDQKAFGSKSVYEGALSWVEHDLSGRKEDFVDFFRIVKLHLLPASYLEDVVANQNLVKESHDCKDHFQKELLYHLKLPASFHRSLSSGSDRNIRSESLDSLPRENGTVSSRDSSPVHTWIASARGLEPSTSYEYPSSSSQFQQLQEERRSPSPASSNSSNDITTSKELVKILRHGKYSDIYLNEEGYASVTVIIGNRRFRKVCGVRSMDDIRRIVQSCDKKRFHLKRIDGSLCIRATRGHSIPVNSPGRFR